MDPVFERIEEAADATAPRERREAAEAVDSVRRILREHYAEPMGLPDIAARVGLSRFHLARIFRRETGGSIHQELLAIRLEAAWQRIIAGERNIATLALEVGFCDHSHFTKAFRLRYGASPSEVRRKSMSEGD